MKKILLIVGMILCVAVIGSVFAVAVSSASVAKTVSADNYIYLGFDGSLDTTFTLEPGVKQVYTAVLTVATNDDDATGTFTVTCAGSLDGVSVIVCSDAAGNTAVPASDSVTISGNNTTITGIAANATYYIAIELSANATETQIDNCNGTMTLSFTAAD